MIRVAIIGLGAVTRDIHLPACAQLGDRVRVVAGCDPDPAACALARAKRHVPNVFEDPRAMIEKSKPDVVSVCTPPGLHRDHSLLALRSGCHVFCEKPLAEDLQQADEIIKAAEQAQRVVVINNQFPYMKIHRAARDLINTPQFGRLLYLHAWQTMHPTPEAGWRGSLQRRVCFEFGTHVFELFRYFFGQTPVRVQAHMPRPCAEIQADLINVLTVEFADGRAASALLDRLSPGPERYLDLRLDGERASIHTSIGGRLGLVAGIHTREKRPFLKFDFAQGGKAVLQQGDRSKVIAREGRFPFVSATAYHFANFLKAIETGETPPGNARDNRSTLALVLAAYDSAQSGRSIEMSTYASASATRSA